MGVTTPSIQLRRITTLAGIFAFFVVVLGAYVRLTEAGLACPDWPGCFGRLVVPSATEQVVAAQAAFPDVILHPDKAWIEMIHRYGAATLGILILALFAFSWRERAPRSAPPVLPGLLFILVVAQAGLGMLTVTEQLKPVIVALHLAGGMSTLALLVWLILQQTQRPPWHRVKPGHTRKLLAALALAVLFMQIILGGWTSANHAGLICRDFPTCHGEWVPPMDFAKGFDLQRPPPLRAPQSELSGLTAIHWSHRTGALITLTLLLGLFTVASHSRTTRPLAWVMLGLLAAQITLGISNVKWGTPLVLALFHNVLAAALLILVVAINFRVWSGAPRQQD